MAGSFILILLMPAVQLAVALVAAVIVGARAGDGTEGPGDCLWGIGRITLGMIAGTVVGILVMLLALPVCMVASR
jgi:hypothetical protein